MKNGAEHLIATLEELGITTVAGIPGGANLPLYEALGRSGIRHILARHEQGAAFMAQGMSRVHRRPAVVFATSGPGASNLLTAIADAWHDSVPLIAITGQVPRALIGTQAFQEIDMITMAKPICKQVYQPQSAAAIPGIIREAFHTAHTGRTGPVLIDIPKDVLLERAAAEPSRRYHAPRAPRVADHAVAAVAAKLAAARRPVIIAGGGIIGAEAQDALRRAAQQGTIPVAATLMGLAAFDHADPLYAGFAGMHAPVYTNALIEECDLLIAIGTRFSDRATGKLAAYAPHAEIIHVDADSNELGRIIKRGMHIHADAREFLERLLPFIPEGCGAESAARLESLKREWPLDTESDTTHPEYLIRAISDSAPEDAIIVTDVGQHQMWTAQRFAFTPRHTLLTSGGLGTMGFGLPAAIGAALAAPDRKVILITGDGSLMMNIQELPLVRELNLDISIFVFNNGSLGLVRQQQELFYGAQYTGSSFGDHDFARIAEAFGLASATGDADRNPGAIAWALERGIRLADLATDADALMLPMVPPGAANTDMITDTEEEELCANC